MKGTPRISTILAGTALLTAAAVLVMVDGNEPRRVPAGSGPTPPIPVPKPRLRPYRPQAGLTTRAIDLPARSEPTAAVRPTSITMTASR